MQDEEFLYLVMEYLPGGDVMVELSRALNSQVLFTRSAKLHQL